MDAKAAIPILSALAQPTRLRVVAELAREHPGGLAVGQLAERVETPQNTMSGHLAILSRAGLVVARRSGRVVEYSVDAGGLRSATDFLTSLAPA